MQDGKPVAYESRKLNPAEKNYGVGEQELLSVIHALKTWRCYVEGVEFTVVTDHNPNTYLPNTPLTGRRARWQEYLSRFHMTWKYIPGRINMANPLSRNPHSSLMYLQEVIKLRTIRLNAITRNRGKVVDKATTPTQPSEIEVTMEVDVDEDTLTELQRKVMQGYKEDPWFTNKENTHNLQIQSGLWYKDHCLVIPEYENLREVIMEECHATPYSGHPGIAKTVANIQRVYWWPHLQDDVKHFIKHCDPCQRNKGAHQKQGGMLKPLPIPESNWESVSMDFITALPQTKAGNESIIVYVDRLSKMVHLKAIPYIINAEQCALYFMHEVVRLHGIPKDIVSDRDKLFTSEFWREFMRILGTQLKLSTAYHPQTDGQTERMNRTLQDYLRHYIGPLHDDWDEHLDMAEFAINNAWQESIKMSPFEMVYGLKPITPMKGGLPNVLGRTLSHNGGEK